MISISMSVEFAVLSWDEQTHWSIPIHVRLKELHNKHGLMWLCILMLHHRFSNLRDIFQGDLNWKLMDSVISRDSMDLPCNCNNMMKVNG